MDEKCTVDETAGRIPALDQLASKYFAPLATAEKREALLGAAKSLVAAKSEGLAEYYVKIMSKFLEGAEEAQNWIAKESERLGTLAAKKGTVTMKKLEELKMKQNVSFVISSSSTRIQFAEYHLSTDSQSFRLRQIGCRGTSC
jgi:vacuolar-type H+-ATPase subunit D/Vma8